jgi:hypothetical protein
MSKMLLLLAFCFIACNPVKLKFPKNFIAAECKTNDDQCVDYKGKKLQKGTILKTQIARAAVLGNGVKVSYSDKNQESIRLIYRDFYDKNIYHVLDDKIVFQEKVIKFKVPRSFKYEVSKNLDNNLKYCINLTRSCDTQSFKNLLKHKKTLSDQVKIAKNRNKKYGDIKESYEWYAVSDQIFTYNETGSKKLKTFPPQGYTFRQEYDSKKQKFIYNKFLIKFPVGWIRRSDLAPKNVLLNTKKAKIMVAKLLYDKKCANKDNVNKAKHKKMIQNIYDKQIRSIKVAYKVIMKKKLDTTKIERKNKSLECK